MKTLKNILLISLIFTANLSFAQEDTNDIKIDTLVAKTDTSNISLGSDGIVNDSIVNENDTIQMGSDGLENDSTTVESDTTQMGSDKKKKKKKKKKKEEDNIPKPEKITKEMWRDSTTNRDSILSEWDKYDHKYYGTKYKFTSKDKEILSKPKDELSFWEKMKLRRIVKKPEKARKKIQGRRIKRLRKVIKYYDVKNMNPKERMNMEAEERIRTYKIQREFEGRKEAMRKQKVARKFDNKETKLRKKYKLTVEEKSVINKAGSVRLRSSEKAIYRRAVRKQESFTEKYEKLKNKRWFKMQDKATRKRIKKEDKEIERKRRGK